MRGSSLLIAAIVVLAVSIGQEVEGAKKKKAGTVSGNEADARLLHAAGVKDDVNEIKAALEAGADINSIADQRGGRTALMAACLAGHHRSVKLLLKRGADYQIGERDGYTCLHGAGFQGRPAVAKAAIAAGVPAHDMHQDGYLPIHRCTWGSKPEHAETLKVLVEEGKENVDAVDGNGLTPLLIALSQRELNALTITTLLELGANANAAEENGTTALHLAVSNGPGGKSREKVIKALLKAGANPDAKDNEDVTAKQLAKDFGYAKLFLEHEKTATQQEL